MQFDKISVYSVRDTFVQTIEDKILSEELKIGDKLPPAKELCRQMGVSLIRLIFCLWFDNVYCKKHDDKVEKFTYNS